MIVAVTVISTGSPANAADVVVEAPLATRIVQVSSADLASPDQLAALHRRVRAAVSDACREEYRNPTGTIYYYRHACNSGSLRDALSQLREIQTRQLARHAGADAHVAILIRPK
jgi:UrcA family protein